MNLALEIAAVTLNLVYLILLIRENIVCWFFGIAGSLTSIYLFYSLGIYVEFILYIFYVIIGIYGYSLWKKENTDKLVLKIGRINPKINLIIICFGSLSAFGVGYTFASYTDANNPYLDAFTSCLVLLQAFLRRRKSSALGYIGSLLMRQHYIYMFSKSYSFTLF